MSRFTQASAGLRLRALLALAIVAALGVTGLSSCGQDGQGAPSVTSALPTGPGSSIAPYGTPAGTTPTTGSASSRPGSPTGPPSGSPPSSATTSPGAPASCLDRTLSRLSLEQRAAQLIMTAISAGGLTGGERRALEASGPGGILLLGKSGSATKLGGVIGAARAAAGSPAEVAPLVAVDQEGGKVQRLSGDGFDDIPPARIQGGWSASTLQTRATTWGRQLRGAGVNTNLAPVADVVPAGNESSNAPIGKLDRGFGSDPAAVGAHAAAFVRGMRGAGVLATLKHFPGIGRVTGNTDVSSGVVDTATTRGDPALAAFRAGIAAGADLVMVTTVTYNRIDPANRAVFSPTIITGMIRGDLRFGGVVISDDLGVAKEVSNIAPGERAVRFVAAGGDIVITADADLTGTMLDALVARARADPGFSAALTTSVRRVLALKARHGLLRCG